MGTRSLTTFVDREVEIVVMYRQYDGYPTGHGQDLLDFLKDFEIVNGLSANPAKIANGMGCLSAQVVAHFKEEPGGFYLHPGGSRDCGEEYIYTLTHKEGRIWLTLKAGAITMFGLPGSKEESMPVLFDGFIADFDPVAVEKAFSEMPAPKNDYIEDQEST